MSREDIVDRRDAAKAQQRRAVDAPAPVFIEACPGSGKTRVITDRHLAHPAPLGRAGRALVSFTRTSSTELRRRCVRSHRPELTEYPHFIGTIDRFFWQFLVRPACTQRDPSAPQRRWQHLESWDAFPNRVRGGWDLGDFIFCREPEEQQCRAVLRETGRNRSRYKKLTSSDLAEVEAAAVTHRDALCRQGYVTGHEIRIMALRNVLNDNAATRSNLTARFGELVVDEVQDCSAMDLAILGELHRTGLPLVLVGDLDQAIYAFRDAQPDNVREFAQTLSVSVTLTGNWRSSPAICSFAHTLRRARSERSTDDAVGDHHAEPSPVLLLPSRKNGIEFAIAQFHDYAEELGVSVGQRLVTAHHGAGLPMSTRWRQGPPPGSSSTKQLVWATTMLRHDPTPGQREQALAIIERALLRVWCPVDPDGASIEALCADHMIDGRELRHLAAALPLPDPGTDTLKEWCTRAYDVLRATAPAEHLTLSSRGKPVAAPADAAKRPRAAVGAASVPGPLPARADVIHQVKGSEADAVLLIIPDNKYTSDLVDSWDRGDAGDEGVRVLYVAATRARRLLAVCIPDTYTECIAGLLSRHQVPYEQRPERSG